MTPMITADQVQPIKLNVRRAMMQSPNAPAVQRQGFTPSPVFLRLKEGSEDQQGFNSEELPVVPSGYLGCVAFGGAGHALGKVFDLTVGG